MSHLTYDESKKQATKIILILAAITLAEVAFVLIGKGYIGGLHFPGAIMAGAMIIVSLIKAYLIVYEFMHMKYEVPGLVKTVLLPFLLLVWAVIAFSAEGVDWMQKKSNNNAGVEVIEMNSEEHH